MRTIGILPLALLAVATLSGVALAQPPAASPVAVAEVVEREISSGQTFVGTVTPLKSSVVGSAVAGRVLEFPVNEGDRVRKGQTLAQLLTETIRLEVETAKAELELRKQELAELENGSRPEEVEQARAATESARARAEYARSRHSRMDQLFQQGRAVTREQLEETHSALVEAEQGHLSAKANYELLVAGPRKERIAQAAARMLSQQETVNRLEDQMGKHRMKAPFDGYVIAEHTEVGEWVSAGDPVAEVVALDEVDVQAHVVESQAAFVRRGMPVRVEVPALPQELFDGEVASVVPQADLRSRTFPVKVRLKNRIEQDEPLLKAGMLARVMLPTGPKTKAMLVPKDAVVLGGKQPEVWVVDRASVETVQDENSAQAFRQGPARRVPVTLGIAFEESFGVAGDLKPGDWVVVRGNERIRPPDAGQPPVVRWPLERTQPDTARHAAQDPAKNRSDSGGGSR
ncbi:MAG: efflux RND transporter periplasmic adaptor subunit [Planctomycetales bacterium]